MGRNGDGDVSVLLCPVMQNANGFPAINNVCNRSYIFSNCTLLFDKSFFRISVKKDNVHKCKKTFRKEGTKQIIWEKSYPQQMRRFYRQKWVIHELIHIIHRKKDKFCAFVREKTEQRFCAIILKFTKIWNSIDFWIMKKLKNMSNNE